MKTLRYANLGGLLFLIATAGEVVAMQPPEEGSRGRQVLALLKTRCVRCHGPEKEKAKLNLNSLDLLAKGSRSGLVVQPGKPTESLLWTMVDQGKMPPKEPLATSERELLRRWIEDGAPGLSAAKPVRHGAFQPLPRPVAPQVEHSERAYTAIDRFVESALERQHLTLGPTAEREVLLRRVSFNLTGLPPTPAEHDAFLLDAAADAYTRKVERYLASPRYGERWAKYWLDAAGYADSNGYFSADSDRPLAHHYRDYVIRSFNEDKPYGRFVREQLAGDEIAGYDPQGDLTGSTIELITATHFLRNAPDGTGESDGNPDEVRTDRFTVLEGNLQVVMNCLLGVTIQCARCHDHKFEPINQDEYYRLQAIFYPVYCPDRWTKPNDRVATLGTRSERETYQKKTKRISDEIKAYSTALETVTARLREQLLDERLEVLDPAKRALLRQALAKPAEKQTAEEKALVKLRTEAAKIEESDLLKRSAAYATVRDAVHKAIAALENERPRPLEQRAVFGETDPRPLVHHVLLRGQHNAQGPEVQPGVPAALCTASNAFRLDAPGVHGQSSGRRSAFARWVTSPENPLLARVMVNRVWQHHFGIGLVASSANLGQSGAKPSHPELLDYLAGEFIRGSWSVKALHRVILHSAVYRQSSALRADALAVDPDNRLLWRYPLRRLDAEAIRDAMLEAAGRLDPRMYGPYVPTQRLAEGNVEVDEKRADARRRSIYLQQRRTQVATFLELFDAPSVVSTCTFRNTSTVPLQSLALLNSPFALTQAEALAARLEAEAGPECEKRVSLAFRLICGREPAFLEKSATMDFLTRQQQLYAGEEGGRRRAWADFCQMMLASNAFLYVE
jgi:hypothetical protein